MKEHWHTSVDAILFAGISAIIVINLVRIIAAKAASRGGTLGQIGQSLGALVK